MMKYRPWGLLFLGMLLSACAAQIDDVYLARMNGMIGQSEKDLINAWGVPDKSYQMNDGTKIVTYTRASDYASSNGFTGAACMGGIPGSIGIGTCVGGPSHIMRYYCDVNFKLAQGRINDWSQQGNNCPRIR